MTFDGSVQVDEEIDIDDFLEHFGVKGMRWGVVNSEKHDKIRQDAKTIEAANARMKGRDETAVGKREAARILRAYADRGYVDSGDMHRQAVLGKAYLENKQHAWKKDPSLAKDKSVDEIMNDVVKQVNPDYGSYGTKMNCRRCTFAYEMRRRGNDVSATLTKGGTGQNYAGLNNAVDKNSNMSTRGLGLLKESLTFRGDMMGKNAVDFPKFDYRAYRKTLVDENGKKQGNWFSRNEKTANAQGLHNATHLYDTLAKQGNGARGELGMMWIMGGGHSMAYEVVRGKTVIFDTQNGKHYPTPDAFTDNMSVIGHMAYTRLDNVDLNDDYLKRWLKDA